MPEEQVKEKRDGNYGEKNKTARAMQAVTPDILEINETTELIGLSPDQSIKRTCPIYSNTQVRELLTRVADNGSSLKEECVKEGLSYNAIWKRVNNSDELIQLDRRAREASIDLRVRQLNDLVQNEDDVNRARLLCDNIKWEAARVLRKIYGEHIVVESKGTTYGDKSLDELKAMAADYALLKTEKTQVIDTDVD